MHCAKKRGGNRDLENGIPAEAMDSTIKNDGPYKILLDILALAAKYKYKLI
jgi:hypothetical protein